MEFSILKFFCQDKPNIAQYKQIDFFCQDTTDNGVIKYTVKCAGKSAIRLVKKLYASLSGHVWLSGLDCMRYPGKTALSITVLKSDRARITHAPL